MTARTRSIIQFRKSINLRAIATRSVRLASFGAVGMDQFLSGETDRGRQTHRDI